jgi:formyltetrahydrofolate deformylase
MSHTYILTLSCPDQIGIVASVATFLAEKRGNILASAQFEDRQTGLFFMRVRFEITLPEVQLRHEFQAIAATFRMVWEMSNTDHRPAVMIMVSKFGHCLNDLLYRHASGQLKAQIVGVASNHLDFEHLTRSYGIPYHHFPITPQTLAAQENALCTLMETQNVETIVLARYMRILSPKLCASYAGRIINIHHSFLPSFKGASPYSQAYQKGVKLIGATAHYVTADLDEGPIIEQDVTRVDHAMAPDELMAAGRDVECAVLARALRYHLEKRVILNGHKTVVFR